VGPRQTRRPGRPTHVRTARGRPRAKPYSGRECVTTRPDGTVGCDRGRPGSAEGGRPPLVGSEPPYRSARRASAHPENDKWGWATGAAVSPGGYAHPRERPGGCSRHGPGPSPDRPRPAPAGVTRPLLDIASGPTEGCGAPGATGRRPPPPVAGGPGLLFGPGVPGSGRGATTAVPGGTGCWIRTLSHTALTPKDSDSVIPGVSHLNFPHDGSQDRDVTSKLPGCV
jgi:hypothetical protein